MPGGCTPTTALAHPDDRSRLFESVSAVVDARRVLYPGSYIDIAPSFQFDDVTYVDLDRRAARFFAEREVIQELVVANREDHHRSRPFRFDFHHLDYTEDLPVAHESVDLLISLYAGFVSEYCTRYLRTGGRLLVNSSHGDVAMASLDPRLRLVAVVDRRKRGVGYRVGTDRLDEYLIPKRGMPPHACRTAPTRAGHRLCSVGWPLPVREGDAMTAGENAGTRASKRVGNRCGRIPSLELTGPRRGDRPGEPRNRAKRSWTLAPGSARPPCGWHGGSDRAVAVTAVGSLPLIRRG